MTTTVPQIDVPAPLADLSHTMQCMEVWGGNIAVENQVSVTGINAWILSQPYEGQAGGGDIHYMSMCGSERTSRFILADVSGHGAGVSQLAVILRDLMRKHIGTPSQVGMARAINRAFGRLAKEGNFATAAMMTYYAPTDQLITCLAGHPRPLWYQASTKQWTLLSHEVTDETESVGGLPLGIISDTEYYQFVVTLGQGDLVVLYTDGLIEARAKNGKEIGEQGLLNLARSLSPRDPAAFGREIIGAVDQVSGLTSKTRGDDLTVLVMQHTSQNPGHHTVWHALKMAWKYITR